MRLRSCASSMMIVSYRRSSRSRWISLSRMPSVITLMRVVVAHPVGEPHLVADEPAELDAELLGDALGDRARGDAARLRVRDRLAAELEADLRQLRGLARAGRAGDDHDLVIAEGARDLLALPGDGQLGGVGDRREAQPSIVCAGRRAQWRGSIGTSECPKHRQCMERCENACMSTDVSTGPATATRVPPLRWVLGLPLLRVALVGLAAAATWLAASRVTTGRAPSRPSSPTRRPTILPVNLISLVAGAARAASRGEPRPRPHRLLVATSRHRRAVGAALARRARRAVRRRRWSACWSRSHGCDRVRAVRHAVHPATPRAAARPDPAHGRRRHHRADVRTAERAHRGTRVPRVLAGRAAAPSLADVLGDRRAVGDLRAPAPVLRTGGPDSRSPTSPRSSSGASARASSCGGSAG